jgi:hypothetical protein
MRSSSFLKICLKLRTVSNTVFDVDAWKQSYHQGSHVTSSLARQMNWSWLRAANAMFITSFTSFVAFLMTAISPLPLIRSFGIFTATMVAVNYGLVITWYPTAVGKEVSYRKLVGISPGLIKLLSLGKKNI